MNKNVNIIQHKISKYNFTFILEGGGVYGSYHIGFFKEIRDLMKIINITKYYGSSAGALVLPYISTNNVNLLEEDVYNEPFLLEWNNFISKIPILNTFWQVFNLLYNRGAYRSINTKPINRLIDNMTSTQLNELSKCHVSTVNVTNGNCEYLQLNDNIISKLQASSAIWIGIPPIIINNNEYVDGGLAAEIPCTDTNLLKMLDENKENLKNEIIVVLRFNDSKNLSQKYHSSNIFLYLNRLFDIGMNNLTKHTYFDKFKKKAIEKLDNRFIEIVYDEFVQEYFDSVIDFDPIKVNKAIKLGQESGNKFKNILYNLS